MSIIAVPLFEDNYAYLLIKGNDALVVDPGEAAPVAAALSERGLSLRAVLLTHHHHDHSGGALALHRTTGCAIIAPTDERLAFRTVTATESQPLRVAGIELAVLETPAHTRSHCCYYWQEQAALFTGDTLFSASCGRLFEGTAEHMVTSFQKIFALPAATTLHFAHEYTADNLRFAATMEPGNHAITKYQAQLGSSSTPSSIALERQVNPFARAVEGRFTGELQGDSVEVFRQLRELKDQF